MKALTAFVVAAIACGVASAAVPEKTCGIYSNIIDFASQDALNQAVNAQPSFLLPKHKAMFAHSRADANIKAVTDAGFNTVFMTIYPIWGKDWWTMPAARNLVKDPLVQCKGKLHVHLGLSLFNGNFCDNPGRYPGASRTIQCDGTRPSWVCFFDDELWKTYIRNVVEFAKLGKETGGLDGIFLDPEAYGPECYLCFCDNCVRKFNAYAHTNMPLGLVKPDAWLHEHKLWEKYTIDYHDHEVFRHANEMREVIRAVDPDVQLSSLLWDYPVAVGIHDARERYFRNLARGLGTKDRPSWTLPEHTYYSDGPDLARIIEQIRRDIDAMGAAGTIKVLPGIRVLRRPATNLVDEGGVIARSGVPGYWFYELADLQGKAPIDFEGELVDSPQQYWKAFKQMNQIIQGAKVRAEGDNVTVEAGAIEIGDRVITIDQPQTFQIAPATSTLVENEEYTLTDQHPDRWISGTHLKGCVYAETALPGALVPGSVIVRLPDGTNATEGKDYVLDTEWGALARVKGGRIAADTKVKISYRVGELRLDSLVTSSDGKVSLVRGTPHRVTPEPPAIPHGSVRIANVYMPTGAMAVEPWQIFIVRGSFREPDDETMRERAKLVPKTLEKLRSGQPVHIVAWGDSVTAGGEASTPAKAFGPLFASRLGERFPQSKITFTNAGIGATATPGRLGVLKQEVLDHHPDLVTIEFVNDMGLPDEVIRANYESAFSQIRAVGAEVILLTPHFTMPAMMGLKHPRGKETRHTVALLRELAEQYHVALADTSKRWAHLEDEGIPYTTLLRNGINHPDDRGHEMFVKDLLSFFPK